MTRILVLYASTHGHTAKIAARIAEASGPDAELRDIARSFAGALQYRDYDLFTRLLMKRGGHPTDTSRDHDFTDRDAVERFGAECAGLAAVTAP